MKKSFKNSSGFTLIELLVVVLIIGILSAVALPQYQKTVLKSRTAEAWTNMSALLKAGQVYCLENPSATYITREALSVDVEDSKYFGYSITGDCTSEGPFIVAHASYRKDSADLHINSLGYRICKAASTSYSFCRDIGFSAWGSGDQCVSGTGDTCYYMN